MRLGILYERLRKDEKLLIESAKKHKLDLNLISNKELVFKLEKNGLDADIVLERCINHLSAMYSMAIINSKGIVTINSSEAAEICGSKFLVTEALIRNKVPTPKVIIAFSQDKALQAMEKIQYPIVLKPAIGSWGKLLAKINDREAAEAVLDHKSKLGSYHHMVFYIQDYVKKPNRDIRVFVVGDQVLGAVYRSSKHWITHVDKGATVSKCPLTEEIRELALKTAHAVKGEVIAVDMVETGNSIMVLEVEYTPEFSDNFPHLDNNIIDVVIKYLISEARR